MKFIISMGIRKLPGSPQPMHEIYRDFLEEAVLAEELGFDAVWASEHHFLYLWLALGWIVVS